MPHTLNNANRMKFPVSSPYIFPRTGGAKSSFISYETLVKGDEPLGSLKLRVRLISPFQ